MKRGVYSALAVLALLAPVFLVGCLPYAYPKLSYVPGYESTNPNITDIHAFRVDVTAHQADIDERNEYTLTPVARRSDGSFPPQTQLSLERGYYVLGVALNYNVARLHTVSMRLYRPGFQPVELTSWDSADKVQWQPAKDWVAQEKALGELLRRPAMTAYGVAHYMKHSDVSPDAGLSLSKPVADFVAAEYERVATLAPPADAIRLRDKARHVTELPQTSVAASATPTPSAAGKP
jgi:hypothetical protein